MIEHNNREKAKKVAEYITGKTLRKYVAEKVKKYVGENKIIFDGACGSGQLEQYIIAQKLIGVDIQNECCIAFLENFKNAEVRNISFFLFQENINVDCVVMNPPFSISFNSLSEIEKDMIKKEFEWKKNGKVDDIFVLKSLKYTQRYGFYILFPGVGYRSSEKKFRELIGNKLVELNSIKNAFEHTNIDVLFVVIDKQKKTQEVYREIYDCKKEAKIKEDKHFISVESWDMLKEEKEKEKIDIDVLEAQISKLQSRRREIEDELDLFIKTEIKPLFL